MATVEMFTVHDRNTLRPASEAGSDVALAEQFCTAGAVCGAVLGAVAGGVLGAATAGAYAVFCGPLGVMAGSGVVAVAGRYVLFPLWATAFGARTRQR